MHKRKVQGVSNNKIVKKIIVVFVCCAWLLGLLLDGSEGKTAYTPTQNIGFIAIASPGIGNGSPSMAQQDGGIPLPTLQSSPIHSSLNNSVGDIATIGSLSPLHVGSKRRVRSSGDSYTMGLSQGEGYTIAKTRKKRANSGGSFSGAYAMAMSVSGRSGGSVGQSSAAAGGIGTSSLPQRKKATAAAQTTEKEGTSLRDKWNKSEFRNAAIAQRQLGYTDACAYIGSSSPRLAPPGGTSSIYTTWLDDGGDGYGAWLYDDDEGHHYYSWDGLIDLWSDIEGGSAVTFTWADFTAWWNGQDTYRVPVGDGIWEMMMMAIIMIALKIKKNYCKR